MTTHVCDAYSQTCQPTPTATVSVLPTHHHRPLPHTGSFTYGELIVGISLIVLGALIIALSTYRRGRHA